jgi:hypothetical protein
MSNYDANSEDLRFRHWRERFPSWAYGYEKWVSLPDPPESNGVDWLRLLPDLRDRDRFGTPLPCPRVFVSHRNDPADIEYAKRIAYLASQNGFYFWLDVFDPHLQALPSMTLTAAQRSILTAGIIEMGLLNSSHVLAVMTPQTRGTLWMPYEYGRVKEAPPISLQAGCWTDPTLPRADFPEYIHLGHITVSEPEIALWFQTEAARWSGQFGKCSGGAPKIWPGPIPPPLP